jgi:phosphatidylglycerol---prolipoprotein diacylglyceryl transferase
MAALAPVATLAAIGWKVLDRFHFGSSFAISPHGLGIALGFLAGAYVFINREAPRRGYPDDAASAIIFWALIGAVVGSRLGYVFTHLGEFKNLVDVFKVYQGGLSQLGGVVGAILLSSVVVRRHHLPILPGLDAAALGIPLGVVLGRIGDLIIGDHLGKPTSWLLAFKYDGGQLSGFSCNPLNCTIQLSGNKLLTVTQSGAVLRTEAGKVIGHGVGVHQTAMYDLGIAMALVLFLVYLNGRARRPGILFFTYAAWYGTGRIVTDFLRVENRFFGLTGSQWTSIAAVTLSVVVLVRFALKPLPREEAEPVIQEPVAGG